MDARPEVVSAEEWQSALTVFFADEGKVYRSYNTTARGVDRLLFVNNMQDLLPYGRQEDWEDSPPGWPQYPTYG